MELNWHVCIFISRHASYLSRAHPLVWGVEWPITCQTSPSHCATNNSKCNCVLMVLIATIKNTLFLIKAHKLSCHLLLYMWAWGSNCLKSTTISVLLVLSTFFRCPEAKDTILVILTTHPSHINNPSELLLLDSPFKFLKGEFHMEPLALEVCYFRAVFSDKLHFDKCLKITF